MHLPTKIFFNKYLPHSRISNNGKNRRDIIKRIFLAKIAVTNKKALFTSRSVYLKIRKNVLKMQAWSMILSGCEI